MTTSSHAKHVRNRLIAAAIVVGILAGALIVVQARGRVRRQAAIGHIVMSNEALMPGDLKVTSDRNGRDPSEWLASIGATRNLWDMAQLSDPRRYQELHDEAVRGRMGEDARLAIQRFEECIRPWLSNQKDPDASLGAFWIDVSTRLREADLLASGNECEPAAIQLLAAGLAPWMQLARGAKGLGPIDPRRVARLLDQESAPFPRLPVVESARIADAAQVTAIFDAQSKHFVQALDDVRAALGVADVHRPSHWLLGHVLWTLHVGRALDSLQAILPLLPRGMDLQDIETRLTALMPGDELATALKGERSFGYRVFELLRSGWHPKDGVAGSSFFARMQRWLVGDEDQAAYLEAMSKSIELASKPAFLRKELPPSPQLTFYTPVTSKVLPSLPSLLGASDVLAARLALARAALTSYRGGQEALTFLAQSIDPFSGRPINWGNAQNQVVLFWSVGPDGKDDSGRGGSDDIVWTLRLQE